MSLKKEELYIGFGLLIIVVIGTLVLGWYLWAPEPPKPETYATEVRQEDNSLVLERKPQSGVKAPHKLPEGARLERVVQVQVQPATALVDEKEGVLSPVTVDMSLVRLKDDSHRLITSSPDGTVIGGVDIPVEPTATASLPKWAAGVTVDPFSPADSYGGILTYHLSPLVIGGEVFRAPDADNGFDLRGIIGTRFDALPGWMFAVTANVLDPSGSFGGMVTRDIGPFMVGGEVYQDAEDFGTRALLMLRF